MNVPSTFDLAKAAAAGPLAALVLCSLVLASGARAAEKTEVTAAPTGTPAGVPAPAAAPAPPPPLQAIVRGFFIQTRMSGGYLVAGQKIENDPQFPVLNGESEGYGAGTTLGIEIGFDISHSVAIEAFGSAGFVSGTRTDRVRDLGLLVGGLAVRLAIPITERFHAVVAGGGGYASADNLVEAPERGPATMFNAGLEYYAHVRHFSFGLDLSVLAPVRPLRIFVALGPQVKYTF